MSTVDNHGGGGGDQPHDDDEPRDSKDANDNNNNRDNKDRKSNNNWWSVTSSTTSLQSGGGESVAASTTTSTNNGGGSSTPRLSIDCDESNEFREALELATRNSIQGTVGAYSVVPGSVPSRREVNGTAATAANDNNDSLNDNHHDLHGNNNEGAGGNNNATVAVDVLTQLASLSNSNLPINIDFIAEATLVPQDDEDDETHDNNNDMTATTNNNNNDEENNDVDTLGLAPHISPEVGGVVENDGVSFISAMTNPTAIMMEDNGAGNTVTSSQVSDNVVRSDDTTLHQQQQREDEGLDVPLNTATVPITATAESISNNHRVIANDEEDDDEEAQQQLQHQVGICEADASTIQQASVTHSHHQHEQPQHLTTVYEAEIVDDNPMNLLRTKAGKIMCSVALGMIVALSLGLAFGITFGNDKSGKFKTNNDGSTAANNNVDDDPKQVLNTAGGNFCNAGVPQLFFNQYPSYCTIDDVQLGGTIQQAVANAQRRPHPYCVEVEEGVKTSESLYGWHVCTVTNVTPQISLVNGGAIRGEIAADTPITREMVWNILPFTADTIAYIEFKGGDIVKVLENALAHVTRDYPLNPYLQAGYPYASGLKFDVDLTKDVKVSNVLVANSQTGEYAPIDLSSSYWMVTNQFIAENGDGYLTDITPMQVVPTKLGYTQEMERFLVDLSPEEWIPPTVEEMSTMSFNATGVSVSFVGDVDPDPVTYP